MREEEKMDSRRYGTIWYVPYPYFEILNLSPNSHTQLTHGVRVLLTYVQYSTYIRNCRQL